MRPIILAHQGVPFNLLDDYIYLQFSLFSTFATFPCKSYELPYANDFELNLQMEHEFREDCYAPGETSLRGLTLSYPSPLTSVFLY